MNKFSNRWIKSYFNFSRKDRDGIIVLSVLILLVFVANIIIDYIPKKSDNDYSEIEKALIEWEQLEKDGTEKGKSLFAFNPNTISETSLDSLLLPEYVKRNLINYREAGGKIKTASNLRKIYGMNDSIYSAIEGYINIPNDRSTKNLSKQKEVLTDINQAVENENISFDYQPSKLLVELNGADSTKLTKLNGVGPVFASRIVKFRKLLGGFYSKKQLLEVYNFPVETYERIEENISIDTSFIKKIRINFAEYSDFLHHPYLNKTQVQSIIKYRASNGAFNSLDELVNLNLVDSVTFIKIRPYLSCR